MHIQLPAAAFPSSHMYCIINLACALIVDCNCHVAKGLPFHALLIGLMLAQCHGFLLRLWWVVKSHLAAQLHVDNTVT